MFQGRRSSLRRKLEQAGDPQIRSLRADLAERQERVAQLELELFDARASLAKFERELDARIRPLEARLTELQRELQQARHQRERMAQWGDRLGEEGLPDVVEQFRKAWTPREPIQEPSAAAEPKPSEPDQAELKRLFRELAKRFHPDLTTDMSQKAWRQQMMARVNAAYAARDLTGLQALASEAAAPEAERELTREEIIGELIAEARRLDGVIFRLQAELAQLMRSDLVQLSLEASIARRVDRDLLGEMAADLKIQIAEMEAELAALS